MTLHIQLTPDCALTEIEKMNLKFPDKQSPHHDQLTSPDQFLSFKIIRHKDFTRVSGTNFFQGIRTAPDENTTQSVTFQWLLS